MAYIKSYSNYTLKKKHQLTSGGTVYERDFTTIGGLNQFSKDMVPIYRSGNYIISVRKGTEGTNSYTSYGWEKNGDSEVWTLDSLSGVTNETEDTMKIVLKQDYYNLRDFAYYGSCTELIRASLTDIIARFPGELYVTDKTFYATDDDVTSAFKGKYVDNPFSINIHTERLSNREIDDPLRYFCNEGYKNFQLVSSGGTVSDVTSWSVTKKGDKDCPLIAVVKINSIEINVYKSKGNVIYTAANDSSVGYHIRPKNSFYLDFFDTLDSFERVLLNKDTTPKYSATFEVLKENDFGYFTEMKKFIFPTTYGGYNLAVNDSSYSSYLDSLVTISEFYDEYFCDNLYRSMTHEAIKNFDWSYKKEYQDGDSDDYVEGGQKIQKVIRLFGREFDEIKYYIDGIANSNTLSYGEGSNMPDYFLTDSNENIGWDLVNVYPYSGNEKSFFIDTVSKVSPYSYSANKDSLYQYGYYVNSSCEKGFVGYSACTSSSMNIVYLNGALRQRIHSYMSDKEYSMNEVNNQFLKMLRLNSYAIFSHKGTVEGMEMLLGLFGLKSKRWVDLMKSSGNTRTYKKELSNGTTSYSNNTQLYDYEIKEYVESVESYIDDSSEKLDRINQTKTIAYDTDDYRNCIYEKYRGLPVRQFNGKLFPYYSTDKIIDGNPWYQMYGGWLWKSIQFNKNDEKVTSAYTETVKEIPSVRNVKELIEIPYNRLYDNVIYEVQNTKEKLIIVDGRVYELHQEYINGTTYDYFSCTVNNNGVRIGGNTFIDDVYVSDPCGDENSEMFHDLSDYENGSEIRVYILKDASGNQFVSARSSFTDESLKKLNAVILPIVSESGETYTDYYILTKKEYKNNYVTPSNSITEGWRRLQTSDSEYKRLSSVENYFKGNNPHNGASKYDFGAEYLNYFKNIFKYACENMLFDERKYTDKPIDTIVKEATTGFTFNGEEASSKVKFYGVAENKDGTVTDKNENYISERTVNIKRMDITFYVGTSDSVVKFFDAVVLKYLGQMIPSNTIVKVIYQ